VSGLFVGLVLGVAVVLVLVAVVFYVLILRRGRRVGTRGVFQRSRLVCPKCGKTFDYDWLPGASFSAVRLGTSRYMSCPLCHRWSLFDVYRTLVARIPPPAESTAPREPPLSPG